MASVPAPVPMTAWRRFRQWGAVPGAKLLDYLKAMSAWFVPMLITAAATAYLSYYYNQKANSELAVQQQTFSDLQSFRNSGGDLDTAFSALSDAIIDGRGLEESKAKMRAALSRHISDSLANEKALGSSSKAYITGLGKLRFTVDALDEENVETASQLWEQSLSLLSQRRKLISSAQSRITQ